jgi:DNA (cytosine-5)-methyltransferase 3A
MAETAELGAVVWARVAGQGSWPAQVFDESLVSSRVKRSKRAGTVLLAFFGDSTSGWCAPPARSPLAPSFFVRQPAPLTMRAHPIAL